MFRLYFLIALEFILLAGGTVLILDGLRRLVMETRQKPKTRDKNLTCPEANAYEPKRTSTFQTIST